jgi:uncharacterized protein
MHKTTETCWVVTEGTAGMENQALGLAERLDLPVTTKKVRLGWPWSVMAGRMPFSALGHTESDSDSFSPPWPRLVIGCGRQSIPMVIAIKKASGGATIVVQCQHPRLDIRKFDLVVPPEHDGLVGENVFPILGSPNRITPVRLAEARSRFSDRFGSLRKPVLTVLIGGKSSAYRLGPHEADALGSALRALSTKFGLIVMTSRRTGPENIARIASALEGSDAYFWNGEGENPYFGALAWADAFLVTADSVNLACEAAATGKPIHIFALPGGSDKFRQFHSSLEAKGITRPFAGDIQQWNYAALDETGRAASRIRTLLDLSMSAPDARK